MLGATLFAVAADGPHPVEHALQRIADLIAEAQPLLVWRSQRGAQRHIGHRRDCRGRDVIYRIGFAVRAGVDIVASLNALPPVVDDGGHIVDIQESIQIAIDLRRQFVRRKSIGGSS